MLKTLSLPVALMKDIDFAAIHCKQNATKHVLYFEASPAISKEIRNSFEGDAMHVHLSVQHVNRGMVSWSSQFYFYETLKFQGQ